MTKTYTPRWMEWAREIQAISQIGLAFSENEWDTQRYRRLTEIAGEIVHVHTGLPRKSVMQGFLTQLGYATPKVDVRGAVVRNGGILLVQEHTDGLWCMPGGWADVGSSPSEMIVREVWEESGFEVIPERIIGMYDANRTRAPLEFYHAYKIVFLCTITGGEARSSNETLAVDFFSFDDLPPLSTERTNRRHLVDVLAHLQNPDLPATLD